MKHFQEYKTRYFVLAYTSCLLALLLVSCSCKHPEEKAIKKSKEIISGYKGIFTTPPEHVPSFHAVDGPITGNGDIGLTVSGLPEVQRYWISKNDFWKSGPDFRQCGPSLIGGIDVLIDELKDASYHIEQILYEPVIKSEFSSDGNTVNMNARVLATDNVIVLEIKVNNKPVQVQFDLWVKDGYGSKTESGSEGDVFWVTRKFNTDDLLYPTEATIALRCLESGNNSVIVEPGKPVTIAATVRTNHESGTYQADAMEKVANIDQRKLNRLKKQHDQWWQMFWAKSFVEIEDKFLEKYYYASHYIIACCSRNINFPPGLFGNWVTMDRLAWAGDIHLNYNHEAPFWAVYSSNRVELADPYDAPLLEHLDIFKENARKYLNKNGAYASVGIGPKGLTSRFFDKAGMDLVYGGKSANGSYEHLAGQPMFLGQKSNAVFASMNMIMRYYYTYDETYVRKVYPYLFAVAEFWEDYLCFENGRYVIYDDSYHEVGPWQGEGWENGYGDFNSICSLGLLKVFFNAMIEIGRDMNEEMGKQEKWQHIYTNLSDFPIAVENGRRRFRACEGGDGAAKDIIGLNKITTHALILPATNIGLSSDPGTLKMIHADIREWSDDMWLNFGMHTIFNATARVGYDPDFLFLKAKDNVRDNSYPNFIQGALENQSGIPGMINEMMLQCHGGIIRIFPVFPDDQKASFYRLRTYGAFLVSSAIENGLVHHVYIESERGRDCKILNPWPDKQVRVYLDRKETDHVTGTELLFKTQAGEQLLLVPEGTDLKTISLI